MKYAGQALEGARGVLAQSRSAPVLRPPGTGNRQPVRLASHPHPAFSAQAIPDPEDIGDVYSVVTHSKKNAKRLKIGTNTVSPVIDVSGRQLHSVLLYIFRQVIENAIMVPSLLYFLEFAGNGHAH